MKQITYISVILIFSFINIYSQDSQGFFLNDFEPKTAEIPDYTELTGDIGNFTAEVEINFSDTIAPVSKYIFGGNANVYMGQMINEPVLLKYIRELSPNVIRFPGGNLSNVYFWNAEKNVKPSDAPSQLIDGNTGNPAAAGYWYGKNSDSFTITLDNYYKMLDSTGSTGIICVNYSYARYGTGPTPVETAAKYAADWVRYDNGRTKFWEIGNENAGPWQAGFMIDTALNQDDQPRTISGEIYGKHFKIFADSMKKAAEDIGSTIFLGANLVQYEASTSWNPVDRTWNSGFFEEVGDSCDFFIVHTYYTPYNQNSSAATILNSAATESENIMEYMKEMCIDYNVDIKPIAMTEWNIFAVGSKQSCSFISGMHAAMVLGELIKNKYGMSSRWDFANGYDNGNDHGMFNQGDEPGGVPKWNPRPAYFYMYYFQNFFGDHMVSSTSTDADIVCYASRFTSGEAGLVLVNKGSSDKIVRILPRTFGTGDRFYYYSLTGGDDNPPFSQRVIVNGQEPDNATGGPINSLSSLKSISCQINNEIKISSPQKSVQFILIEDGTNQLSSAKLNNTIHFSIYPNPTTGNLTLNMPTGCRKIEVFDSNGCLILSNDLSPFEQQKQIHLASHSGIYFFRLYTEDTVQTDKFILK